MDLDRPCGQRSLWLTRYPLCMHLSHLGSDRRLCAGASDTAPPAVGGSSARAPAAALCFCAARFAPGAAALVLGATLAALRAGSFSQVLLLRRGREHLHCNGNRRLKTRPGRGHGCRAAQEAGYKLMERLPEISEGPTDYGGDVEGILRALSGESPSQAGGGERAAHAPPPAPCSLL